MESSKYAFDCKTQTHRINLECNVQLTEDTDRTIFDEVHIQKTINDHLAKALEKHEKVQAVLNLEGTFVDHEYKTFNFDAKQILFVDDDLDTYLDYCKEKIISKYRNYDSKYGGEKRLLSLQLHIHKVSPYVHNMDIKKFKDHVIDFQSDDEMSFKRSVIEAGFSQEINMGDVKFPVQIDDLPYIENNNNFSVNVYMLKYSMKSKGFEIEGPIYHTQGYKEKHVNLLLIHDKKKYRYCYIKNLKSLIKTENTNSNFCESCLNFIDGANFKQHREEECLKVKTTFPEENFIKFDDHKIIGKITPFVVYADFQVMIEKQTQDTDHNGEIWTKNIHKHVPYSYWYYIKCSDDEILNYKSDELKAPYTGLDCIRKFVDNLVTDLQKYLPIYIKKYPHDHTDFVPVFIHNLQNYDGHFILQDSTCDSIIEKLDTYFAIYKNIKVDLKSVQIRFLDTTKFLNEPLSTSVKNMEENDFEEIKNLCNGVQTKLALLIDNENGFPHCYIQTLNSVNDTSLPDINNFVDLITNTPITKEKYSHAEKIWKEFNHKRFGDYLDLYLQSQVLLLADVFETFRRFCRMHYQLDPAYYYSLAGFSWDAMLKQSNVKLELLTDVEMLLFIKKGIRGGYTHCHPQYVKSRNKYLNSDVRHVSGDESYIMFFDANNAYGYAMRKPLPYGGFEWVKDDEEKARIRSMEIDNYDTRDNSKIGYILEVDLSYPEELHKKHSDYPFCPQRKIVSETGLKKLFANLEPKNRYVIHYEYLALCIKHGLTISKVHRILKFKQSEWLQNFINYNTDKRKESKNKSEKLLFKMINISVYGKTIMNPKKYGKIVLLDQWDESAKSAFDYITRPDYKSHTICSENLIEVKQHITSVCFKSPIYVGFSILDLAKTRMYEFNYDFMKEKFGESASLLYTDNDSFIFQIKGMDCYQVIKDHGSEIFDTDGFGKNNVFGIPQRNKLEVGYFKDEMDGAVVTEFVGLKPKVYILEAVKVNIDSPPTKRYKDSNMNKTNEKYKHYKVKPKRAAMDAPLHIKENFTIENFRSCLDNEALYEVFNRYGVVDHDVYTQEIRRKCLYSP